MAAVIDRQKLGIYAQGLIGTGMLGGPDDIKRVVGLLEERDIQSARPGRDGHQELEHVALIVGLFDGKLCLSNTEQIRLEEKLSNLAHQSARDMRAGFDEVTSTGIKHQCEPPHIVGDLLQAEIAKKQARSIKYQITTAKLPLVKDLENFELAGTPINEALVRDLAGDNLSRHGAMLSWSAARALVRAISPLP